MNKHTALKQVILETVQEVREAPSGIVYAALVGVCDLSEYNEIIGELVSENKVKLNNHVLIAL